MPITWLSAFLDFGTRSDFAAGVAFWAAVTGYERSPLRGPNNEFATLVPPTGDDYLRVQCLAEGPGRIHLDLHVADPVAAAARAGGIGATIVDEAADGYVVLRSPGGFVFCFVPHRRESRPGPATWPDGTRSAADQVCLDVPHAGWDRELAFWSELTEWDLRPSRVHPDFTRLVVPDDLPLRVLLQRRVDDDGAVAAHLDLAASKRAAEVERHAALGARVMTEQAFWTVLADPTGAPYCITDRDPDTGLLPA